ncbi:PAS domain S-box-containing protein [Duganella sp. 3397]|uniref:PAS domain-containing protein n=1 Tax=Duganella sp. 3397 TaxID=2817732 RepID=UPI0028632DFB|nr:PAS domain-containing protein [Duganella sp. 3397]MDR7049461.1 PAS domain S-box-containing protein [Duganella sp. 3397]
MRNVDPIAPDFTSNTDIAALFNAVPTPCLAVTPDLVIVAVNDAYLRVAGARRELLLGRKLFDVFPDNPALDQPDGMANIGAAIARVIKTRAPDTMPIQRYDVRAEDGIGFVERYWKPVHVPVLGADGEVKYVIQHAEELTQRVREADQAADMRSELVAQAQTIRDQHSMAELFQQAPVFMAMLDGPAHRFTFVNAGYLQLIGQRNVLGLTVAQGLPEAVDQGFITLLDQVYRSGKPYAANGTRYLMPATADRAATERHIDFVYQPVRDGDGAVTGILVQGIDVTDRVQREVRRHALVRLGDAARGVRQPDDMLMQACVILGETLGASRVGYGSVNLHAETFTVARDWSAPGEQAPPATLKFSDYGNFLEELKRGNMVAIDNVDVDPRTRDQAVALKARHAGAFVDVPVIEHGVLVAMIFVTSHQARRWSEEDLALIREVAERTRSTSERLRSEIALRASEARFRTITNAMPQMVWSTLPDGKHDYFNQRWYDFTGVPAGSTHGEAWNGLLHADDQARSWALWQQCLATGDTYEIQYRLRHVSGRYHWVLARALPIRDEADHIIRWMGTCTDIHEQKLAETEWRQASQRKDEFLAMLAHELRNPLAPISTAAQLLKLRGSHEKPIQHASDIIIRQVKHMTDLVDDLLDVSRVTRGLVQLEQHDLELMAIVNGAIEQSRPLLEARHHALVLRLPPGQLHVRGDRTRLVQALANLLNNAAKYTPQGGEVVLALEARNDGGEVALSVADNGIGMAAELLPRVFDLFAQAERTPDRAQGGLGLGLALVKSIAVLHGGSATAASDGAGKGSTFTIALPLLPPAASAPEAPAAAPLPTVAAGGRSLRLMVVDDNQDAGRTLGALLEAQGHQVLIFEDAETALRASAVAPVDAFILDIGLPDMDGYELARRLRAQAATAGKLLIALTGYGQAHDRVLSKAAGFDHHFVKPVDHAALGRVLAEGRAGTQDGA